MMSLFKWIMVTTNLILLVLVIQILMWCYEPLPMPVEEETSSWEETIKSC